MVRVRARKLVERMVKRAIALGGTCAAEHGVEIEKWKYFYEELRYDTIQIEKITNPLDNFVPRKVGCRFSHLAADIFLLNPSKCARIRSRNTLRGIHHGDRRYPRYVLLFCFTGSGLRLDVRRIRGFGDSQPCTSSFQCYAASAWGLWHMSGFPGGKMARSKFHDA